MMRVQVRNTIAKCLYEY